MAAPRETHYDVLGVAEDATPGDIARAYQKLVKQFEIDATPPDPRREARIREAYEVLFDTARREEYDHALPGQAPPRRRGKAAAISAAVLAVLGLGAYFLVGRDKPQEFAGTPGPQFRAELARSVGRVEAIDMTGKAVATGIAFTIDTGLMATTCDGLAPGMQIVVVIGTRPAPARIAMVDEAMGLCKLAVEGAGSWPLATGGPALRAGDRVFAAGVNAAGEVELVEGTVKRVAPEGARRIVEVSIAVAPGTGGRPLLDTGGRVVAAALAPQPGGVARHVEIPAAWAEPPRSTAAPAEAAQDPSGTAKDAVEPVPSANPIQRRAEEIAPKLRPPPTVPDDI